MIKKDLLEQPKLNQAFQQDKSDKKINLFLPYYRTERGLPYVPEVVKKVEIKMCNDLLDKVYFMLF